MNKGKLIVIEGLDGSGKSTQVAKLVNNMMENNIPVYQTREASDGPIGNIIRSEYLSGKRKVDERLINMLYAADRLDHITNEDNGMLKYINNGINVVCDRYYLSSFAYDTYSYVNDDYEHVIKLTDIMCRNDVNIKLLKPDITIFIDISPDIAIKRLSNRNENLSIYEKLDKLSMISLSYLKTINILRNTLNENIVTVNGNQPIDDIANKIWNYVKCIFN